MKSKFCSENCQAKCKPQCSFTKYNFEISSAKFPNLGLIKNRQILSADGDSNVTAQYIKKNYAELVIYFGSLTVEQTDVYAKYEIFSASSAMGGLLGLFLGGSMMTIYEFVELIIMVSRNQTVRLMKCLSFLAGKQKREVANIR